MLASKQLRENLDHVVEQLNRRDYSFDVEAFKALEAKRKVAQIETQELQNLRNTRSKAIGQAKAAGEDIKPLLDEVSNLGSRLEDGKAELQKIQNQIDDIAKIGRAHV